MAKRPKWSSPGKLAHAKNTKLVIAWGSLATIIAATQAALAAQGRDVNLALAVVLWFVVFGAAVGGIREMVSRRVIRVGLYVLVAVGVVSTATWAQMQGEPVIIVSLPDPPTLRSAEPFSAREPSESELAALARSTRATAIARLIDLIERDSGEWLGHLDSEKFRLDESIHPPLETQLGGRQRFNPHVQVPRAAEDVSDIVVFLNFPQEPFQDAAAIEVPEPWTPTESREPGVVTYYAEFGDVSRGRIQSPVEHAFFLHPSVAGTFWIKYTITGRTATPDVLPIDRRFSFTVRR